MTMKGRTMGMKERSQERPKRMKVHLAKDYADAEQWDLEYWQQQTPQQRLSALGPIGKNIDVTKCRRRRRPF